MLRNKLAPVLTSLCFALSACAEAGEETSPDLHVAQKTQALEEAVATSFLVVYKNASSTPSTAAADIARAGGTFVAAYPFGVAVAKSSSETFAADVKAGNSAAIDSAVGTQGAGAPLIGAQPAYNPNAFLPNAPAPKSGDSLVPMQWNMKQIRAAEARQVTRGSRRVVVGLFDSGIDDTHPDLVGQVDVARSTSCQGGVANSDPALWRNDWVGHGTHVAGIIAAKDDGKGVVGIAPNVSLAAIAMSDENFFVFPESFICGLHWAATHDIQLVNASLILDPFYYYCPSDPTAATISKAVQRALDYAQNRGVTVVAAASNEQQDLAHKTVDYYTGEPVNNTCKLLPAEMSGVITVSATNANNKLSYYSNYGYNVVDLAAPGGDKKVPAVGNPTGQIVSAISPTAYFYQAAKDWNGRVAVGCPAGFDPNADWDVDPTLCSAYYVNLQGTSMATPHVAGVAALAVSRFNLSGSSAILGKLALGATKLPCPSNYNPHPGDEEVTQNKVCEASIGYNPFYGSSGFFGQGQIDALRAVNWY